MDGKVEIQVELGTKGFEKQITLLERKLNDYIGDLESMSQEEGFNEQNHEVLELQANIEALNNKINQLKKKQQEINDSELPTTKRITQDIGKSMQNIKTESDGIGGKVEGIISKIARWGLAIFSVRSAYMFIRQAVNTVSQANEKIATDIQYIRFALASALQPIIETIINLVYKLLAYIGYIAKAWFGVNLFANASAKSFQKVNAGVKDTNKSAKQLQKTLAGFDEMNILQDTGATSTGGGGGGITTPTPSMDLSSLENVEIPSWLKWIGENGKTIRDIIIGIGEAFLLWKVLQWASQLGVLSSEFSLFGKLLQGIGLVAIIIGIYNAINDLISLIENPSWNTFYKLLGDISLALGGLGTILVTLNASNPFGWVALGIGVFGGLISAIGNLITEEDEEEKKTISVKDATNELKNAKDKLRQSTNRYTSALDDAQKSEKELEQIQKKYKISGEELFNSVLAGTKTVNTMTKEELAVYKAYLNNEGAQKNLKEATDELNESKKENIKKAEQQSAAIYNETGKFEGYFKTVMDGYKNKQISESQMLSATANVYNQLSDKAKETFAQNLPDDIKVALDKWDGFTEVLDDGTEVSFSELASASKKTFAQSIPNDIQKTTNKVNSLIKELNKIPMGKTLTMKLTTAMGYSGGSRAKGGIYYPPRLATGGIINRPGAGVPYHGAVIGERGAEAVVPLTDSQQMERLGATIGRYISVNLNNIVEMNGRVISRELKQIQNEENFAFNGG